MAKKNQETPKKPNPFRPTLIGGLCFCFLFVIFLVSLIIVVGWSIWGWDVRGIEIWTYVMFTSISFTIGIVMGANMR